MFEFMTGPSTPEKLAAIIILIGIVTYFTRIGGHLLVSQFKHLHPRVEAALEAVPAAVLITLILPPVLNNGPLEIAAMAVAFLMSFRFSPLPVLLMGMAIVIIGRVYGL